MKVGGKNPLPSNSSRPIRVATPWVPISGGSSGCSGVVSGSSAPEVGLAELEQGAFGHLHTSCIGRALLFAQDRRKLVSEVIFGIALGEYDSSDRYSFSCPTAF